MNSSFNWRDMLRFDKMIAPAFLTVLYYIHATISILASLWFVMKGMDSPYGGGFMVMGGLVGLVLGPFLIRLLYELLIVIFKIHTRLSNIDYRLREWLTGVSTTENFRPGPGTPQPISYSTGSAAAEQNRLVRPSPNPESATASPQPIGSGESAAEPVMSAPASPVERPMPTFWGAADDLPPFTDSAQSPSPVPSVELNSIGKKIPNWPATVAALIILYAVVSPYAVIGFETPASLGKLAGLTYSIKNSSLGALVVLATLVMLGASAGGLKWVWFVLGYTATALGALVAFVEENSVFSQMSKAKATIGAVGSTLGDFMPQTSPLSQQLEQTMPSTSHFLTITFYLFLSAMLFLGYWAFAGRYQERGLLTTNG